LSTEDNKATVQRFLEGMAAGDQGALEALLTEEALWWIPISASRDGFGRPLAGREAAARLAGGKITKAFQPGSTTWKIQRLVAEDDYVSSLMHRLAIGANGQPYDNEYNFMFRFESGRIAEVWEVMDTALAFRLLAIDSATPR
jgi:ketosteroid isomerase-like protein